MKYLTFYFYNHLKHKNLCRFYKLIEKFLRRGKNSQDDQHRLEEQSRRTDTTWLQTYCQATVIETVWSWKKGRQIDQWNRTETQIDSYSHSPPIFGKEAKATQWIKTVFSAGDAGMTGHRDAKKKKSKNVKIIFSSQVIWNQGLGLAHGP